MNVQFVVEPIGNWTDPLTQPRTRSPFRAAWSDTLELLRYETGAVGARLVVVQLDVTRAEIRRDGMVRAGARVDFPGVRVSFASEFGPLMYATDRYDRWQDNCRAIALSLRALRAVDRYGVNKRGQQYTGFLALPAAGTLPTSVEDARRLLESYGGEREALKRTHPDLGGDVEEFRRVQAARDLLAGAS